MPRQHERNRNLVVRLDDDEHAMIARLAEDRDEPMTMTVRKMIRTLYVERFGVTPPKRAK